MMLFFGTRLGKILIWKNFLKRESPTFKKIAEKHLSHPLNKNVFGKIKNSFIWNILGYVFNKIFSKFYY